MSVRRLRLTEGLTEIAHAEILRFSLPRTWQVDANAEGDGIYWDPDGVGTLRLSLVTAKREGHGYGKPALDFLRQYEKLPGAAEQLPSGCAFQEYAEESEEQGRPTQTRFLELAGFAAPHFFRLAMFSYTRWADSAETAPSLAELEVVRSQVRSARFASGPAPWEQGAA